MFSTIFEADEQRTALQAAVWYLIFLVLGVILGGVVGGLVGAAAGNSADAHELERRIGTGIGVVYVAGMGIWVIWQREKNLLNVALTVIAPVIALFLGALGGLISIAILTTRPPLEFE